MLFEVSYYWTLSLIFLVVKEPFPLAFLYLSCWTSALHTGSMQNVAANVASSHLAEAGREWAADDWFTHFFLTAHHQIFFMVILVALRWIIWIWGLHSSPLKHRGIYTALSNCTLQDLLTLMCRNHFTLKQFLGWLVPLFENRNKPWFISNWNIQHCFLLFSIWKGFHKIHSNN